MKITICIDPPAAAYNNNKLFDISDNSLNRDDSLLPYYNLKNALNKKGIDVLTADMVNPSDIDSSYHFYSIGSLLRYKIFYEAGATLKSFAIFEPPVVDPRPYKLLPELTRLFTDVFTYNNNYFAKPLRKIFYLQYRKEIINEFWEKNNRLNKIVMINGNHKPTSREGELYSKRIKAIKELSELSFIDLYGQGWLRWWGRNSLWFPYWSNINHIITAYKGSCVSKYEIMSNYKFALCFENMRMEGYITEKIFDCFYCGTIPIYFGAPDVQKTIPKNSYIDYSKFKSPLELINYLNSMSTDQITEMKHNGRLFIESTRSDAFRHSLMSIFNV